jgi:23S rRNA (cytidine2498-2'-O)-methyltransferase
VLQKLGARVISVDKAALDPQIARLPGVVYRRESAFALDPQSFGRIDWLVADIACYPQRLLTLIRKWIAAGTVKRFVCTIKFQGPADLDVLHEFAAIPGSHLIHLHHNKHELTWIKPDPRSRVCEELS